jgi:hypothetical protein
MQEVCRLAYEDVMECPSCIEMYISFYSAEIYIPAITGSLSIVISSGHSVYVNI